jgi:serine/threonine protein kinase
MMVDEHLPGAPEAAIEVSRVFAGRVLRSRFELLEEIGRGGLSRVFKAKDLVAERAGLFMPLVALKIIEAGPDSDPDVVALMHREARRLRDLVHPNIVRVFDMDVEDDIHFMVMEYLDGQTLARALRSASGHCLPPHQIERILIDVCAGLQFAHRRNILHADLKPANVFITTSGQVKLIDFNIAYPAARAPRFDAEDTVAILGRLGGVTPAYASPQRLSGEEPSEGDDIFSLAVLIYLALTGKRPFGKLNALEAREKGMAADLGVVGSAAARRGLARALALDDRERTPSIREFLLDYEGAPGAVWVERLIHWLRTWRDWFGRRSR